MEAYLACDPGVRIIQELGTSVQHLVKAFFYGKNHHMETVNLSTFA